MNKEDKKKSMPLWVQIIMGIIIAAGTIFNYVSGIVMKPYDNKIAAIEKKLDCHDQQFKELVREKKEDAKETREERGELNEKITSINMKLSEIMGCLKNKKPWDREK